MSCLHIWYAMTTTNLEEAHALLQIDGSCQFLLREPLLVLAILSISAHFSGGYSSGHVIVFLAAEVEDPGEEENPGVSEQCQDRLNTSSSFRYYSFPCLAH